MTDSIAELARKKLAFIHENREKLVEAWIAETGLTPSESELVEQHLSDGSTRVFVRKRESRST